VEFRCEQCSHVGEPEKVAPGGGGLVLTCANCGHENALDVGGADKDVGSDGTSGDDAVEVDAADAQVEAVEESEREIITPDDAETSAEELAAAAGVNLETLQVKDDVKRRGFGSNEDVRTYLRTDAMEALVPEPGPGPRCPKCAKRLDPDVDNCTRCGLNQREARSYDDGEAPWERPPRGKEGEYEQATLLWQSLEEDWSEERLSNFVDFIKETELLDLGIRRLRFHLIEHPDDQLAREYLRDLAESLQTRLIIAQVQAQASADEFQDEVSKFKNRMVTAALVFWGGIFLLFLAFFWDNCSQAF
jgi:hypothetical protein